MGIFSTNHRPGLGNYTIEAAEGYGGIGAGSKILYECHQNDMALFEGLIAADFQDAYNKASGYYTESSVVTEGAVGDFFKKIAEMFKKLAEKIAGLFKSFMTKFVAVFIRDNKELVKKYKKQVVENISKGYLKEMEFKMHSETYDDLKKGAIVSTFDKANFASGSGIYTFDAAVDDMYRTNASNFKAKYGSDNDKLEDEMYNAVFKVIGGNGTTDKESFREDLRDYLIGDIESFEGYESSFNNNVMKTLTEASKTIKSLNTCKAEVEKVCKKNVDKADKAQGQALKLKDEDLNKGEKHHIQVGDKKVAHKSSEALTEYTGALYHLATVEQTMYTTVATEFISCVKVALKDARSVFIKAAAGRKPKNEAAELFDMIDEAVSYDVDIMFEGNTAEMDTADIEDIMGADEE